MVPTGEGVLIKRPGVAWGGAGRLEAACVVGRGGDRAAFADHLSNGPYRWERFDKTTASGLGRAGLSEGDVRGWVGW